VNRRLAYAGLSFGLLVVSTLISVGLAELALRLFSPQSPSWLAIYRRHPELPFHALMPDENVAVDTGETHWTVRTDDAGFRTGSHRPAEPACTDLWLGDSFAFGHGVDYDDSIVGRVQANASDVLELNTAVPGYGPVQYRQILEYAYRQGRSPEVIYVVTYVGNDFHDCVWDKDVPVHEGILGHAGDLKSWLKTHSHLYRLASAAYHRFVPTTATPYDQMLAELADPNAWADGFLAGAKKTYPEEMSRIQAFGRERGAEVRFVILPTKAAVDAARDGAAQNATGDALLPVREAEAALRGIGASILDVTSVLAQQSPEGIYLPFDGHFTSEGNRIVSDALVAEWPPSCRTSRGGP
jgi:hypothetical protein